MTREELRDYVDEQRSLDNIPYHVYSALIDGIDTLEQEPCEDAISRQAVLASIKNLYPDMPIADIFGARRKWLEKYAPYFECENAVEQLPSVKPQAPSGDLIRRDDVFNALDRWYSEEGEVVGIYTMIENISSVKPQPCEDAISRDEAIKSIDEKAKRIKNADTLNGLAGAVGILFDLPSVKPQGTGHWIDKGSLSCRCDQCGCKNNRETKFCPNCGCAMVEPQEGAKNDCKRFN